MESITPHSFFMNNKLSNKLMGFYKYHTTYSSMSKIQTISSPLKVSLPSQILNKLVTYLVRVIWQTLGMHFASITSLKWVLQVETEFNSDSGMQNSPFFFLLTDYITQQQHNISQSNNRTMKCTKSNNIQYNHLHRKLKSMHPIRKTKNWNMECSKGRF